MSKIATLSSSSPPASRSVRSTSPAGTVVGDDEREVDAEHREARDGPARGRCAGSRRAARRDRARTRPRRQRHRGARPRPAAIWPTLPISVPLTSTRALRPAWKPGPPPASEPQIGQPQLLGERFEPRDRVGRFELAVGTERADRARCPVAATATWSRSTGSSVPSTGAREHGAQLEQRHVGVAVRDVGAERREQPGQQRGPQHRLLGAQRVLDLDHRIERRTRSRRGRPARPAAT